MLVTLGLQRSNSKGQWAVIMLKSKKRERREGKLFFMKYSAGRIVEEEEEEKKKGMGDEGRWSQGMSALL